LDLFDAVRNLDEGFTKPTFPTLISSTAVRQ
jgi:hypothetical protein